MIWKRIPTLNLVIFVTLLIHLWLLWWLIPTDVLFGRLNYGTIVVLALIVLSVSTFIRPRWKKRGIAVLLLTVSIVWMVWLHFASIPVSGSSVYPLPRSYQGVHGAKDIWLELGQPTDGWGRCPRGYKPQWFSHLSEQPTYQLCR